MLKLGAQVVCNKPTHVRQRLSPACSLGSSNVRVHAHGRFLYFTVVGRRHVLVQFAIGGLRRCNAGRAQHSQKSGQKALSTIARKRAQAPFLGAMGQWGEVNVSVFTWSLRGRLQRRVICRTTRSAGRPCATRAGRRPPLHRQGKRTLQEPRRLRPTSRAPNHLRLGRLSRWRLSSWRSSCRGGAPSPSPRLLHRARTCLASGPCNHGVMVGRNPVRQ